MKKVLLSLLFYQVFTSCSQIRHMLDTIRYDLTKPRIFFVGLDGKNSVIGDLNTKMFGLQLGYLYNRRTNIYLGYYASYNNQSKVIDNPSAIGPKTDSNTVFMKYNLAYFNLGCEYYFFNSHKWRFSIPLAVGIGVGSDQSYTRKNQKDKHNYAVIPIELGFTANYKITWWLWAGAGLGTRVSLASSKFNGPFYTLGLSLKTGAIYKKAKKWYKGF